MKDINDKYDHLLGDKLRGLREEPPADMFDRIEATLAAMAPEQPVAEQEQKRESVVMPLWRRPLWRTIGLTAAAAVVALAVVIGVRQEAPSIVEGVALAEMPVLEYGSFSLERPAIPTFDHRNTIMGTTQESLQAQDVATVAHLVTPEKIAHEVSEAHQEAASTTEQSHKGGNTLKSTSTKRSQRHSRRNRDNNSLEEYWRGVLTESESEGGFSLLNPSEVKIYASNAGFGGDDVRLGVTSNPMMVQEQNNLIGEGSYTNPLLVSKNNVSSLEHSVPITLGITVGYRLSDHLSVESGLLYTSLDSRSETTGSLSHYVRQRTMSYIGIPLEATLSVAEFYGLELYASLGTTAEFNILAEDYITIDRSLSDIQTLDTPLLTMSLNLSAGLNYNLWGNLGLYGEVGCSYWAVDPTTYPENYRTLHPFSFTTQFGLRFMFE